MAARKRRILEAARKRFSVCGYSATSIQDIAREAQVSSGNIYTHFPSKHALLEELSGEYGSQQGTAAIDLPRLLEHLASEEGLRDAKLDLNLWSEATRDSAVKDSVQAAMNAFRRNLRATLPPSKRTPTTLALIEAVALGMEVQRCLGRKRPPLRALLPLVSEEEK